MAVLSALFNMKSAANFQQVFNAKDITSNEMNENIRECFNLYFGAVNLDREDDCRRIPVLIVNKLTKTIFSEYKVSGDNDYAVAVLDALNEVKHRAMQSMLIGGEALLKPVPMGDRIAFFPVRRDCFVPFGRGSDGEINDIGLAESTYENGRCYTLFERRTATDGGLRIQNKLYVAYDRNSVGTPAPLNALAKYAELEPEFYLPVSGLGLVRMSTPLLNCVDGSADGICVYSPAVGLIKNINRNERQLVDEFELGQARIMVSSDLLKKSRDGSVNLYDKVFTALDDDPSAVGITPFNPQLRDQSYLNRSNDYLRSIESLIGFKRGILSDVPEQERTATEITDTKGDYNLTITDFQRVWTSAVKDACALAVEIGKVYRIPGATDINVDKISIDYGDGVLYNRDKTAQEMLMMVSAGLLKPELYLAWYYDLPAESEADIEKIRREYMPAEPTNALSPEGEE